MAKAMFPVVVCALAGCASLGEWRELRIDGSNDSAFDESLSLLDAELSYSRREMLALALVDIVRTEVQKLERTSDGGDHAYTYEDYRSQLDGLTYEGVISLADQTGPTMQSLYYSGARRRDPWAGRPWPQTDPNRFPSAVVMPAGMSLASP